jgi:hypothetical protein
MQKALGSIQRKRKERERQRDSERRGEREGGREEVNISLM